MTERPICVTYLCDIEVNNLIRIRIEAYHLAEFSINKCISFQKVTHFLTSMKSIPKEGNT